MDTESAVRLLSRRTSEVTYVLGLLSSGDSRNRSLARRSFAPLSGRDLVGAEFATRNERLHGSDAVLVSFCNSDGWP